MATPEIDSAQIKIPPPLIFVACLAIGIGVDRWLLTISLTPRGPLQIVGAALCLAAVVLSVSASTLLRRAGTSVRPDKPSTVMVITGPYRFTRNPLYLALCLLHAGIALLVGGLIPLLMTLVLAIILRQAVISREEHYLSGKFGPAYSDYCIKVRRWL